MAATAKPQAPLFTKRALFTLIWPLLLEQTLSVTMGMADTPGQGNTAAWRLLRAC